MITPSDPTQFMMTFLSSLSAAAVAAFTVWVTNHYAERRERVQATRTKTAEHRKMLREKLEQLVVAVSTEFEQGLEAAKLPHRYRKHKEWTGDSLKTPTRGATTIMFNETSVIQELYFPELTDAFASFIKALSKSCSNWENVILNEFLKQPDTWQLPEDFWDQLVETFRPASTARKEFLVRARTMLANDYYIKEQK